MSRIDDDYPEESGPASTSGKALFSLLLGVLSFCIPLILTSFLAILLGFLGIRDINASNGRIKGKSLAIGGIITGFLSIGTSVVVLVILVIAGLGMGVQQIRQSGSRATSDNNLRQIGLAMQNYNDTNMRYPPAVVYDQNGKPLYSWRVLLLPYIERQDLYAQFHLDEPWDSPHNQALVGQIPRTYSHPAGSAGMGMTYYQVFDGPGAAFNSGVAERRLRPSATGLKPAPLTSPTGKLLFESIEVTRYPQGFKDGSSNTFLVVEAGEAVPWTKPQDLTYDPKGPLPKLGGPYDGDFSAVLGDTSIRRVRKTTPEDVLRAYITADGKEPMAAYNLP